MSERNCRNLQREEVPFRVMRTVRCPGCAVQGTGTALLTNKGYNLSSVSWTKDKRRGEDYTTYYVPVQSARPTNFV